MRLNLLISLKNGRALKTYGVKTVPFNNMKFTFIICVVIAFSYSECAWAQRDILTDLNYLNDLSQIDRSPIFKSFKRPEEYEGLYKRWPWRHSPDEDIDGIERTENEYEPDTNSENLVKIQEVVDMASAQLANRRHPSYEKLLTRLQDRFKHLKDTTDKVNLLSQYLFSNSPNTDRLEEVRMYPEDFTFNEEEGNKVYRDANDFDIDDEEETVDNDPSPSEPLYPQLKPVMRFKPEHHKPMHGMHHGHEEYTFQDGEEFPVISFKDVPVADDPSEFGFGPSDPRFDGTPTKEALQTFKAPEPLHQQSLYQTNPTNNVKLTLRSDPQKITNLPPNEDIFSFSNKAKFSGSDIDVVAVKPETSQGDNAGVYIIAVVAGISAAATVGLIAVGIGWYKFS